MFGRRADPVDDPFKQDTRPAGVAPAVRSFTDPAPPAPEPVVVAPAAAPTVPPIEQPQPAPPVAATEPSAGVAAMPMANPFDDPIDDDGGTPPVGDEPPDLGTALQAGAIGVPGQSSATATGSAV